MTNNTYTVHTKQIIVSYLVHIHSPTGVFEYTHYIVCSVSTAISMESKLKNKTNLDSASVCYNANVPFEEFYIYAQATLFGTPPFIFYTYCI